MNKTNIYTMHTMSIVCTGNEPNPQSHANHVNQMALHHSVSYTSTANQTQATVSRYSAQLSQIMLSTFKYIHPTADSTVSHHTCTATTASCTLTTRQQLASTNMQAKLTLFGLFFALLLAVCLGSEPRQERNSNRHGRGGTSRRGGQDSQPADKVIHVREDSVAVESTTLIKPTHRDNNQVQPQQEFHNNNNNNSPTKTTPIAYVTETDDQALATDAPTVTSTIDNGPIAETTSTSVSTTTKTKAAFVPPNILNDAPPSLYHSLCDWTMLTLLGLGALATGFAALFD